MEVMNDLALDFGGGLGAYKGIGQQFNPCSRCALHVDACPTCDGER